MDQDNVIVVSADTHIGPRLAEDLRPYCPSNLLDAFDEHASRAAFVLEMVGAEAAFMLEHPNAQTEGHFDSATRLADYDYDGVAAGIIFHGSANFQPIPFGSLYPGDDPLPLDLQAAGLKIYNRWVSEFCSQNPDRHIGLAYLPMWDIDAAVAQVEAAHDAGMRGLNFPAFRANAGLVEYNNPAWDPFWATVEERGLPLVTHVGGADEINYGGPEASAIRMAETGPFFSHRAVWWLIYGGVFERFPGLKLVITETPGSWFPDLARELDANWRMFEMAPEVAAPFFKKVPQLPSEYMKRNVFLGASFASAHEAAQAVENGISSQLLWGSDYPHVEGTYLHPGMSGMPSVTRLALRNTYCELAPEDIRAMVGGNAIDVYGLDAAVLANIAREIDAPTIDELKTPIDAIPEGASPHAFRTGTTGWN